MKTLNTIQLLIGFLFFFLTGCKNAEELSHLIYMTGTEKTTVSRITIDGPQSFGVSATCTAKAEQDLRVSFRIDNSLVDKYNNEKGTNYKVLPEQCYNLEKSESVIKQGSCVSTPVMFNLTTTEGMEDGAVYLVPISLASAEGYPILESCRTNYIVINRTIITKVLSLSGGRSLNVPNFTKDPSLQSIPQITMECRVKVNSFCNLDPYISSIMGIEYAENFLLRFGDVTIKNNQFQVTAKDQVTPEMTFDTGKWYHLAVVFDGNQFIVYINGEVAATKQATRGPVNLYDGGDFHFGFSYNGRFLDGFISEARIWTRPLSQVEIQENMCYVQPDSEGLLAYWRFNDGDPKTAKDFTGHGYDAQIKTGNTLEWADGIKCPEPQK